MEAFGMFGFMFGMIAFLMAGQASRELKALRKDVEELKQRLAQRG